MISHDRLEKEINTSQFRYPGTIRKSFLDIPNIGFMSLD